MIIYAKVKALAKRRPVIERTPIEVPDNIQTAAQLVEVIVRQNVRTFNEKRTEQPLFPYLSAADMEHMDKTGKFGFGDKKNENRQDEEEAVRNALECYQDGIFRVFVNEQELEFGQDVTLRNEDELIFMRLTMLAGRLW